VGPPEPWILRELSIETHATDGGPQRGSPSNRQASQYPVDHGPPAPMPTGDFEPPRPKPLDPKNQPRLTIRQVGVVQTVSSGSEWPQSSPEPCLHSRRNPFPSMALLGRLVGAGDSTVGARAEAGPAASGLPWCCCWAWCWSPALNGSAERPCWPCSAAGC